MSFTINNDSVIVIDEKDWPGVFRVAGKVSEDFNRVFGSCKDAETVSFTDVNSLAGKIVAGCIGKSALIDALEKDGLIDLSQVRGKNEVYLFTVVQIAGQDTLVIAGSDKRGTIYGLFHISELMEVSPWVWFVDVTPAKMDSVEITDKDILVSKEPSVKYRGFFINDEWPSYGNWTMNNFGGFNAKMYDHVFELLLRMKGNYMWPAMWSSCFSDDGPGVPQESLPHLYERFYRTDKGRSRELGGTGLGLSIVYEAVSIHGGEIHPEAASPHGLMHVFTLPMVNSSSGI